MIKFDKLSANEIRKLTKQGFGCIVLAAVTVGSMSIAVKINQTTDSLYDQRKYLGEIKSEETKLAQQIQSLEDELSKIEVDTADIPISKEELVVTLGDCAHDAGVAITALSSKDAIMDSSVAKYNFKFEVKGTSAQISKALSNLDEQKLHYAVNKLSLRQDADYLWLQRNFDEQITWWDLSNVTTTGGFQARPTISAEEILNDEIMTIYLDIDFIFVLKEGVEENEISNIDVAER